MPSRLICQLNMPYISLLAFYVVKPDIMETPESQNTGIKQAGFGKPTELFGQFKLIGKMISQD